MLEISRSWKPGAWSRGNSTSGSAASRFSGTRRSDASLWALGSAATVRSCNTTTESSSGTCSIGGRTSPTSTTPALTRRSCSAVGRSCSSISTSGAAARKRCTIPGTTENSAEPTKLIRRWPV